uniref:Putative 60s ribosomal protein l7 n=1 Tax=Corethrella appendiculata TaxID=1370023 RepID=U5EXV0_9DIPT
MEKYTIPNKLPSKQVNILAQRKARIKRNVGANKPNTKSIKKKFKTFTKPEVIIANFRKAERDSMRMKRVIYDRNLNVDNVGEHQLALIFRHRGDFIPNKSIANILKALHINRKRMCALIRLTAEKKAMLKLVEPYVTWGFPNISTIRDLIYKYGVFKTVENNNEKHKIISISCNKQIEDRLGHLGIICLEDLLHEIITVGQNFDAVIKLFGCFKLKEPVGGYKNRKGLIFKKGGESGFRGEKINNFFKRLL